MRYVRPFDPKALAAGEATPWLIAPEDEAGCALRVRRGGEAAGAESKSDEERYAIVIAGHPVLTTGGDGKRASPGDLIFIPAGQSGRISGDAEAVWLEVLAAPGAIPAAASEPKVVVVDQSRFEGSGFAYQSLIDRTSGSAAMRMNVLQVQPGAGSPDFHIHAFSQIYLIQEGEMTLDVGRHRCVAGQNSVVYLPPGVVHRNYNASGKVERHISLLAPEPKEGEIFDYAVEIAEKEAELLTAIPEPLG